MKIGSFDKQAPIVPAPSERKAAPASVPPQAEPSAKVALSTAAAGLTGAGSDATFDAGKVERIASAIRDGKFTINAEAIADKLIVNAEELLGRKLS
jgi:negative regulator of flagellin synthesis FlgM